MAVLNAAAANAFNVFIRFITCKHHRDLSTIYIVWQALMISGRAPFFMSHDGFASLWDDGMAESN
jgi:hypothetical protein